MCKSRSTVYVYLVNFVSISLFCHPVVAKNPKFCRRGGIQNPRSTELSKVIKDLENVLVPPKHFGVCCRVSPLGGTENLGETQPPQIKTHITPQPLE